MENMVTNFWGNKKVLVTGHTGFKGSWLTLWLTKLGANVVGYSLKPPTQPSLFNLNNMDTIMESIIGDVRDYSHIHDVLKEHKPEIIFHMAAQPLVRYSYANPIETYSTNVMGTVNILEAVRSTNTTKAIINITTDKCYDNKEWHWGYRENDVLGGYDPYSNSKACSELVTAAFRNSYFNVNEFASHGIALASARAGNVIGGGDWAADRLIPDCIQSLTSNKQIVIRNPQAVRPWQHVLEPLNGYLMLAEKLYNDGSDYADAWNFGPDDSDAQTVKEIVERLCVKWDGITNYIIDETSKAHEATYLKLDCSKAKNLLGWKPLWNVEKALDTIVNWNKAYLSGENPRKICLEQIESFEKLLKL